MCCWGNIEKMEILKCKHSIRWLVNWLRTAVLPIFWGGLIYLKPVEETLSLVRFYFQNNQSRSLSNSSLLDFPVQLLKFRSHQSKIYEVLKIVDIYFCISVNNGLRAGLLLVHINLQMAWLSSLSCILLLVNSEA